MVMPKAPLAPIAFTLPDLSALLALLALAYSARSAARRARQAVTAAPPGVLDSPPNRRAGAPCRRPLAPVPGAPSPARPARPAQPRCAPTWGCPAHLPSVAAHGRSASRAWAIDAAATAPTAA